MKTFLVFMMLWVGSAMESHGVDSFTPSEDLCVVKVNNESARVCYGMNRSEAEKVLGKVIDGNLFNMDIYEGGIEVYYRDDSIAAMNLSTESLGDYMTSRGAHIGMTAGQFRELYGTDHYKEDDDGFIYVYYPRFHLLKDYLVVQGMVDDPTYNLDIYHLSTLVDNDLVWYIFMSDFSFSASGK
ncbi:hypothetical protein ACE3NQ_03745 [Paenibacillus terreus]|uniref:Uncharacterized protein n=1 Tax=Paenibacillus terreus TaxID=1387834 RepID=A0ABV5B546_9BACL